MGDDYERVRGDGAEHQGGGGPQDCPPGLPAVITWSILPLASVSEAPIHHHFPLHFVFLPKGEPSLAYERQPAFFPLGNRGTCYGTFALLPYEPKTPAKFCTLGVVAYNKSCSSRQVYNIFEEIIVSF